MICFALMQGKENKQDNGEAYIFANKEVYFLKISNAYHCYHNLDSIAKIILEREVRQVVTERMPEGISEREGGMRLLSNNEIRRLQDILSVTEYWLGDKDVPK
jgi:hypothetical protein